MVATVIKRGLLWAITPFNSSSFDLTLLSTILPDFISNVAYKKSFLKNLKSFLFICLL